MKSLRLLCGLSAAVLMAWTGDALGQRVQFPTRLPATEAVRVASVPAPDLPSEEPGADPLGEVAEDLEAGVCPDCQDVAQVAAMPPVIVTDPCFPTTTVVPCVPPPCCADRRWRFYGDFLLLRARSAEVAYAVPINGPIGPPPVVDPLQIGPVATVDPGWAPGFRVGLSRALRFPGRLAASYTRFESSGSDAISVDVGKVVEPLVVHPGTRAALPNFLDASAGCGIDFDLIDADYRALLVCEENYVVEYLIGARYARLDQDFRATFVNGGTTEHVTTGIGFDGIGIRLGVEGERRSDCFGLLAYGRAEASLLAGSFHAGYSQVEDFMPDPWVNTGFEAQRIVPILELEVGVGWTGPRERLRLTAGYMMSVWYNAVTTAEFIQAVQTNSFVGLSDTLTFDGVVARVELRF